MDRIDARKLSVEGRGLPRQRVIRLRKQSGMSVKELAAVSGVHFRTVEAWLRRARREGEDSLGEKPRGRPVGTGRTLTMAEEMWVCDQIIGRTPEPLKRAFALWTRPAIKVLIQERFGIQMQDRLVGKYLKRWGFTGQRPVKRALEQDPEQVGAWLKTTYPALLKRARACGGTILWGDETAVKEDANRVRGVAPRGKTPVLATPTRWRKLSMISAISARGEIAFRIVEGSIDTERFIEFLEALVRDVSRKIFLVVDHLRVHHARKVKAWLQGKEKRIELAILPPTLRNRIRTST